MKKYLLVFLIFLFSKGFCTDTISGNIRHDDFVQNKSTVFDLSSNSPVSGAKIYLQDGSFSTVTDDKGNFKLNINIDKPLILQVEKEGYSPFSITINSSSPLKIGIEKLNKNKIIIEKGVFHLGDNVYSKHSANCSQFKVKSIGPYYSKTFSIENPDYAKSPYLVFGSVIGLDTKEARETGQNSISTSYSSPALVIFNSHTIGELKLNGDNLKIIIPKELIKEKNEIVIKTGKNLFQYTYTDYDDIEIANLKIEYQDYYFADK